MDPVMTLSRKQKFAYGVGHVLNDICASMWFTYLLVFFHLVLQFDSTRAGVIMLVGQVADALSTPFVGYFSDKNDDMWLCRYGKRKAWHIVGSLCVTLGFPFIFAPCIGCDGSSLNAQLVYYSAFVVLFQFGWAAVQISHLAMIPELTPHEHHRTHLTSIRSSFTVSSNILVYVLTYVSLQFGTDTDPTNQIGPQDVHNFERVVYVGLIIGFFTTIVFHSGINEGARSVSLDSHDGNGVQKNARDFLRDPKLYQVAVLYTCSRLFMNLSQVYMPLYLHETLVRNAQSLALVPLVMYLSSLAATFIVHPLNKHLGRVISYILGAMVGVSGCFWVLFGSGIYYNEYEIYLVAVLMGFGGNTMLVTTLGVTADLIGPDTDAGAFVYGSMSFADKLANGVAVMIIQHLKCDTYCQVYYRDVLAYVCGGFALIGLIPLFSLRRLSQRYASATIEPTIQDPSSIPAASDEIVHSYTYLMAVIMFYGFVLISIDAGQRVQQLELSHDSGKVHGNPLPMYDVQMPLTTIEYQTMSVVLMRDLRFQATLNLHLRWLRA